MNDFALAVNQNGIFDLVISNGQFKTVDSFDTALQMIIYCERRASNDEILLPQRRRGWWGNTILSDEGFEIGSKLWLLSQERATNDTLNKAIDYVKQATQWLIDDGYVLDVNITGTLLKSNNVYSGIRIDIELISSDAKSESRYFELWNNTGR